jgi:uncharacterized membrane protein
MGALKKWVLTADLITAIIGSVLIFFLEDIVLFIWPSEPMPESVIALLYYVLGFSIAAFWLFNGIAYATIKIFWNFVYDYLESNIKDEFKLLTFWQRIVLSIGLYLGLFALLVATFRAAVAIFH